MSRDLEQAILLRAVHAVAGSLFQTVDVVLKTLVPKCSTCSRNVTVALCRCTWRIVSFQNACYARFLQSKVVISRKMEQPS